MIRNSIYIILILTCCDFTGEGSFDNTYDRNIIPYDLNSPDKKVELPHDLEEVSGLAWYNGDFAAVNDENGEIYIIDEEGKIGRTIGFDSGDDYEGVAVVKDHVYVVKGKGDIYQVNTSGETEQKIETALTHRNDVEGLAYDEKNNRLLLACKENAGISKKVEGRAVYAYNLEKNQLSEKPLFVIKQNDLNQRIVDRGSGNKIREFGPSGIAIHPKSDNLYILSHRGRSLVVLNSSYQLLEVVKLSNRIFKQPEGICFSPDGTLYISNEGRGGRANMLVFLQDKLSD